MRASHVISLYKSRRLLAEALGVTQAAICYWVQKGDRVPPLRAYQLRELRPTIDAELAEQARADAKKSVSTLPEATAKVA
jgi:hypothetical protein